jgi:biopolymer transport protein ExbD
MDFQQRLKPLQTFSVYSLTDIVMLLLIFFLLSSSFIIHPGIKVHLPRSETAEVHSEKSITVTITKDGALYLNDERTSLEALAAKLKPQLIYGAGQVIVVHADRDISLNRAIQVIDVIKSAGGERFLIATEKPER